MLAEIDDAPFRAQLEQAEANVAAAQAAIASLKAQAANVAAAAAQLDLNRATALRNRLEADRQGKLLTSRITGTEQAVKQAGAAAKLADAQVMQSSVALEAAKRQPEVQHTEEAQLAASLKVVAAMLDLAQINLGYTRITAPTRRDGGTASGLPRSMCRHWNADISVAPLPSLSVIAKTRKRS